MPSTVYRRNAGRLELWAMLGWHVGDVVRRLREDRDWKQAVLAEKAGVHLATVVRVESGEDTKSRTIDKIARAFGLNVSQLYGLVPSSQEPPLPQREPRPADSFRHGGYIGADERRHNLGPPHGYREERGRGRR